jgi:hypothetical protein
VSIYRALLNPVGQSLNPVVGKHCGHSHSRHSRETFEHITQREVPRTSKYQESRASGGSTTSPLGRTSYLKALPLR